MNLEDEMMCGDYCQNIAMLLLMAKDNEEFMLSDAGYKFIRDGMQILKEDSPKFHGIVSDIFSGERFEDEN